MKKAFISLLLLFSIISILMTGCKERQITKVIDVTEHDLASDKIIIKDDQENIELIEPEDGTNTIKEDAITQYESTEDHDNSETSTTKDLEEEAIVDDLTNNVIDEKAETVIVAKSENLEEIDERALMLKELDELLEDVLTTLDAVEDDDLSDENLFDEGGD